MVASPMRPLLRSRPALIGLGFVVLAMGALGFVPLFDGPGYESALGAGLILAFAVTVTSALDGSSAEPARPIDALSRGLAVGAVLALAAWLTTLAHGLRAGFCDVLGGSAHFAVGPAAGALLGGAWGALAGDLARGRKRRRLAAVLLAIAAPLASIAVSLGRFVTSPMIFAYDPFVGFFSGTIYDTVIDFSGLLSYRAGTAATLGAAVVLALHLTRDAAGRLRFAWIGRPGLAVAGALALVAGVTANALGYKLGHWQTSSTIAAALGGRTSGARCDVVHARSLRPADMERFTRDCDAHVAAAERWFGAPGPARVTAYVFESSAQKGALMGAADTFIAKPWRREVYVQAAGYPHPVLGHELVHAVSGAFGSGPFHVAGGLDGILPDPGLIEGVAVAAEPREGDLTPREWAKAMKDLNLLPKLSNLFTLGFLGENAGVAYTVSGAFVGWIHDRYGAAVIRDWYGGRSLPAASGVSWAELERAWREDLDTVKLPEVARAQAKARFDRPALFGRRCPHVVDACRGRAERLRGGGDYEGAIAAYGELLTLDPHDDGARVTVAVSQIREGKIDEGTRALERLAETPTVARHVRDRVAEELADQALATGRVDEAARRYRELMARTLDEDQLRTLDVKLTACGDPRVRPAITALLVGTPARGPDRTLALELLGALSAAAPEDGLPSYLMARQYLNAAQYDEAAVRLDRALAATIRVPRVRLEAERLRLVDACALGDREGAARAYARYAAHPEIGEARRDAARSLVERCTGAPPPPIAPAPHEAPSPRPEEYDGGASAPGK
jgi:tetratricopeptide (TPR) repeat protein